MSPFAIACDSGPAEAFFGGSDVAVLGRFFDAVARVRAIGAPSGSSLDDVAAYAAGSFSPIALEIRLYRFRIVTSVTPATSATSFCVRGLLHSIAGVAINAAPAPRGA